MRHGELRTTILRITVSLCRVVEPDFVFLSAGTFYKNGYLDRERKITDNREPIFKDGNKGIKFICLISSLQMLIQLLSAISQHVILILNQNDVSNLMAGQDPTLDCTFGTNEYVTSRILSFGAFIAARLACFQFFGFKRKGR